MYEFYHYLLFYYVNIKSISCVSKTAFQSSDWKTFNFVADLS